MIVTTAVGKVTHGLYVLGYILASQHDAGPKWLQFIIVICAAHVASWGNLTGYYCRQVSEEINVHVISNPTLI